MQVALLLTLIVFSEPVATPSEEILHDTAHPAVPSAPMSAAAKRVFFEDYDRNKDGFVTVEEVNVGRARSEGAPMPGPVYVRARDRNGDGRLSWLEFSAADFV